MVSLYEPGQVVEPEQSSKSDVSSRETPQEEAPVTEERRSKSSEEGREKTTREAARSKSRETGHPEITDQEPSPRIRRRDAGSEVDQDLYQRGGILEQWEKENPQEVGRQSEFTESDQPYVVDEDYESQEDVRETGPVFPAQDDEGEQELTLPLDKLDSEGAEGGFSEAESTSGKPVRGPESGGAPTIIWDEASEGRVLLSPMVDPYIPEWVKREGLDLKVEVDFSVTPDGHTTSLGVRLSSGYPDVDAAVLESVRKFRFNPIQDDRRARGRISYIISTE
jgi:TonB family protein